MKTICVDFDGVIHDNAEYVSGNIITGEPIAGVVHALNQLREHYRVVIFSCRYRDDHAIDAMRDWLNQHDIQVDEIVDYKPHAQIYIDDRAITFNGDWNETLNQVAEFKQWQWADHCRAQAKAKKYGRPVKRHNRRPRQADANYPEASKAAESQESAVELAISDEPPPG